MEGPLVAVLIPSSLGLDIMGASNAVFYRIFRDVSAASPQDRQTSFWGLGLKSRKFSNGIVELFAASNRVRKMTSLSVVGALLLLGTTMFGIPATNPGGIKN